MTKHYRVKNVAGRKYVYERTETYIGEISKVSDEIKKQLKKQKKEKVGKDATKD